MPAASRSRSADTRAAARIREDRAVYRAVQILERRLRKPGAVFKNPGATRTWMRLHLTGLEREVFAALFIGNQHGLIAWEELAHGTIDSATVHPREVVKAALRHNAAAVIFAHNHPSGLAEPSHADRALTDRLKAALALVDIRTLDHFVIGRGPPVSFAERGWL